MSESTSTRSFRVWSRGAAAVIVVAFVISGIICAMLTWPYPKVTVDSPIAVPERQYEPGDLVRVTTNYCNPGYEVETLIWLDSYQQGQAPGAKVGTRLSSQLVDRLVAYGTDQFSGCFESFVAVEIPANRDAGIYQLRAESTWRLNPIRIDTVTSETEPFEIVETNDE